MYVDNNVYRYAFTQIEPKQPRPRIAKHDLMNHILSISAYHFLSNFLFRRINHTHTRRRPALN